MIKPIKLKEGIYEISNFIENEKIQEIMLEIQGISEDRWFVKDSQYTTDFWFGKRLEIEHNILMYADLKIQDLFKTYEKITSVKGICRYKKDEYMAAHTDLYENKDSDKIEYGIILYWNDNYEGGELYYPDIDFKIKPSAGTLIIHRSDIVHQSLPVKSNNTRYFSTCFVMSSKNILVELNSIFKKEKYE